MGIQYAHSLRPTVTVGGVTYRVILDWRDTQSDPTAATAAAERLISDGCVAIVGGCDTNACLAAGNTFASAQIPAIVPSPADLNVTLGNDYYFRARWHETFQGTALADWAIDQGYREIATVNSIGNEYTSSLVAAFTTRFERKGGKVVAAETFQDDASDFTDLLTAVRASGAKAVFAPTDAVYAPLLLNQAANLDLDLQWIAGDTWNTPELLEEAGQNAEGIVLSCAYAEGVNTDFDQGFRAWLEADSARLEANQGSSDIVSNQALAFDCYNVMLDAMEAAGSLDGSVLRDALASLDKTDAVSGELTFDRNGDAVRSTVYLTSVKDGAFFSTDPVTY